MLRGLLIISMFLTLVACGKAPECSNQSVLNEVQEIINQSLPNDILDEESDSKAKFLSIVRYDFQNVRTTSKEDNINKVSCLADVSFHIEDAYADSIIKSLDNLDLPKQVNYTAQLTDENKFYVESEVDISRNLYSIFSELDLYGLFSSSNDVDTPNARVNSKIAEYSNVLDDCLGSGRLCGDGNVYTINYYRWKLKQYGWCPSELDNPKSEWFRCNTSVNEKNQGRHNQKSSIFKYEPEVVTLEGILVSEKTNSDSGEELFPAIKLNKPIDVISSPDDDMNLPEQNVSLIQLALLDGEKENDFKKLEGRSVSMTGTLFHSHTAHHHTDVIAIPEKIIQR